MDFYIGLLLFTLYGMAIGSFINAFEYRTKNNISQKGTSYCPKCKSKIKFYHNIPIISWLILKGKCYNCEKNISNQYIIVELIVTLFFIISYLINDYLNVFSGKIEIFIFITFLFSISYISLYDFKYKEIPTNGYIGLILMSCLMLFKSEYSIYMNLLFIISWFIFFYLIDRIYNFYYKYKTKNEEDIETIGGGDLKISFLLGAIMQQYIFVGIILSYFVGGLYIFINLLINKNTETEVPFGPMMLISTFLILFFNKYIYNIIF